MKRCHRCGREWDSVKRQPGVKDFCEGCSAYLHCCLNCRHHNPALHNQCAIPTTDWVGNKAGVNFCDEFDFATNDEKNAGASSESKARDGFAQLFGASESAPPAEQMDRFKKLFDE